MLNLQDTIAHLRNILDQAVYQGAVSIGDVEATSASRYADEELADFLYEALLYVVSRVESIHFPYFEQRFLVSGGPPEPYMRIKEGTVTLGGIPATRVSYRGYRRMKASCREATFEYPAYAYEDADLSTFPDDGAATAVITPVDEGFTSFGNILPSGVINITSPLFAPDHVGAFVTLGTFTSYIDIVDTSTQARLGTVPSSGIAGQVAWKVPALQRIDKRLRDPIVHRAAALVWAAIGRLDIAVISEERAERSLDGMRLVFTQAQPEYVTPG